MTVDFICLTFISFTYATYFVDKETKTLTKLTYQNLHN